MIAKGGNGQLRKKEKEKEKEKHGALKWFM